MQSGSNLEKSQADQRRSEGEACLGQECSEEVFVQEICVGKREPCTH